MSVEGTIAFCSREDSAPPMFAACLAKLAQQHPNAKIVHSVGNDIAEGRNKAVMQAEGEWIWFIDTDMLFGPATLKRLLAHGVDVVQVLVLMRHPPHEPLVYTDPAKGRDKQLSGPPRLLEVGCVGSGGTLYRKKCFEAIKGPWFEGVIGNEDTCFAKKLVEAGFKLHTDLTTACHHITPITVSPLYDKESGEWVIKYQTMNGVSLTLPQETWLSASI